MRFLSLDEVLILHDKLISQSGGSFGIRDMAAIESAVAQPKMTFGGEDLYPSLEEKAAALCFSLVMNHPFIDGNKRIGHAAMETFLVLNGYEMNCSVDESEETILKLAASSLNRDDLLRWIKMNVVRINE